MTTLHELRDDLRRACADRRDHASSTPARVTVPLTGGTLAVAAAGCVAYLLGLAAVTALAMVGATALIAGVAIRRTLSSLATGAGLLLARPYSPGERVRVYVPCLARVVEAEVVRVGAANTTLMTSGGLVVMPNNQMLRGHPAAADVGSAELVETSPDQSAAG